MNKDMILEILRRHGSQCSEYHKHKETITWTALGLYLAFATAIIGANASESVSHTDTICFSVAIVGVGLLILIFVNRQLYWKLYELSAMNSANKVIIEIINGVRKIDSVDCSIPEGEFLPKVILQEMGWNGTKKIEFKNAGVQTHVKIYANLFIIILMAFVVLFLVLHGQSA